LGDKHPKDIKELQEKIIALKHRSDEDKKNGASVTHLASASIGVRIGIELVSGTIIGMGIGYVLDKILDFKILMLLIFTIFGSFAGILNVYRYTKSLEENERDKDV
jgi:ATP synthase protein I